MSNYIGVRCPVCNKKFVEADDIVVCPICGAPHHRDCYAEKNQCAFAEDHLSGKEWIHPAGQEHTNENVGENPSEETVKTCSRCGAANPKESLFCQACGNSLTTRREPRPGVREWNLPGVQVQTYTISMAYGGLDPEEKIEGETVRDLARYIGAGSAYYLPHFRILSQNSRTISFNFSAMLFSFLYYFYRKMYKMGAFLLVLFLISCIPGYLQSWELLPDILNQFGLLQDATVNEAAVEHLGRLGEITRLIDFIIVVVASMFANRNYMNQTVAAVHSIRMRREQDQVEQDVYEKKLEQQGGCNRTAVILALFGYVVFSFVLSGVMMHLILSAV